MDIALISSELHGFEIKSDRDTLRRLPAQKLAYGKIFHRMTLVVAPRHLRAAKRMIPSWWGLWVATQNGGKVALTELRGSAENPRVCVNALAQLLWREEAARLLEQHGITGTRRKSRRDLCHLIATEIPVDLARESIAGALAARTSWRLQ